MGIGLILTRHYHLIFILMFSKVLMGEKRRQILMVKILIKMKFQLRKSINFSCKLILSNSKKNIKISAKVNTNKKFLYQRLIKRPLTQYKLLRILIMKLLLLIIHLNLIRIIIVVASRKYLHKVLKKLTIVIQIKLIIIRICIIKVLTFIKILKYNQQQLQKRLTIVLPRMTTKNK